MSVVVAHRPLSPQERQRRWNARLYLAVIVALTAVMVKPVVHVVRLQQDLARLDARIDAANARRNLVLTATPRGLAWRLPGWSCPAAGPNAVPGDGPEPNGIHQNDGAAPVSTVHNLQPVVVCPVV